MIEGKEEDAWLYAWDVQGRRDGGRGGGVGRVWEGVMESVWSWTRAMVLWLRGGREGGREGRMVPSSSSRLKEGGGSGSGGSSSSGHGGSSRNGSGRSEASTSSARAELAV